MLTVCIWPPHGGHLRYVGKSQRSERRHVQDCSTDPHTRVHTAIKKRPFQCVKATCAWCGTRNEKHSTNLVCVTSGCRMRSSVCGSVGGATWRTRTTRLNPCNRAASPRGRQTRWGDLCLAPCATSNKLRCMMQSPVWRPFPCFPCVHLASLACPWVR